MFKPTLYYKNIPTCNKQTLSKLGDFKNNRIIAKLSDPCFIFTGTGKIKFPKYTKKIQKKLSRKKITIFLYEPLSLYITNYNRSYFTDFVSDVDVEKIKAEELDSILQFKKRYNLQSIKVKVCDFNIEKINKTYPDLEIECFDIFLREVSADPGKFVNNFDIEKHFFCSNWRYTIHRHIITSMVSTFNSKISWYFKCSPGEIKNNDFINLNKLENNKISERLSEGFKNLNTKNYFFDWEDKKTVEDIYGLYHPHDDVWHNNIIDRYTRCFCAVVNETRFFQPFANVSEKTLRAAEQKLPFILVAPPYSLEYIKSLGFKTFESWWDESYDREENHEVRMFKLLEVIDFIGNKSLQEIQSMYADMKEILDHNRKIFLELHRH